jgi:hypothetical protein
MIPDPSINLVPVIVAAVINMALGMLWYSPYLFGKLWMKAQGKTPEDTKSAYVGIMYVLNTLTSLVFAYLLAHIVKYANLNTIQLGAVAGFWVWLGFVVTTVLPVYLFERRPKILFFIYILYQFVSIPIMGGLLALWK